MRTITKAVSLLLSVVLIFSMLTIIPVTTAFAADGDTVTGSVNKWVKGEEDRYDHFVFEGLYSNVIFLRVDPNEDFNYDFDSDAVWNRTGDLTYAGNNTCYITDWNDGITGYLKLSWASEDHDDIHLVDQLNSARADWYAYTWEDNVTLTYRDTLSPTYEAEAQDPYQHGVAAHYEYNGQNFKRNDDGTYSEVYDDELLVPYFKFVQHGTFEEPMIKIEKCNSTDANIIVPETVPANYPNAVLPGQSFSIIAEHAFEGLTTLQSVTIGDNVKHLAGDDYDDGAFKDCSSLTTVTVGNSLEYVGEYCFSGCSALTDFTTTSLQADDSDSYPFAGVEGIADVNGGFTIHCYHDSRLADIIGKDISDDYFDDDVELVFLDETVTHNYDTTWNWANFNDSDVEHSSVSLHLECNQCHQPDRDFGAVITAVADPDTPPTCTAPGAGHYAATVTYEGQTFTDNDNNGHPCTVPATGHTADPDWYYEGKRYELKNLNESVNTLRLQHLCSVCNQIFYDSSAIIVVYVQAKDPSCTEEGNAAYCFDPAYGQYFKNTSANEPYIFHSVRGMSEITIPKTEHLWDTNRLQWVWDPAQIDSDPGVENVSVTMNVQCHYCDAVYPVEAEVDRTVNPTPSCTETGTVTYTARGVYEGTTYSNSKQATLPALGHDLTHTERVEPEDFETGNIEYWYCSRCGKFFSDAAAEHEITQAQTVIPAKKMASDGGIFAIGDSILFPEGSKLFYFSTGQHPTATYKEFATDTTYSGFSYSTIDGSKYITGSGLGKYLTSVITTDSSYAFTGYYMIHEELSNINGYNVSAFSIEPMYAKLSSINNSNWTWNIDDPDDYSAYITLDDFCYYDYEYLPVDFTQKIDAVLSSEITAPGNCTDRCIRSYTATATAYEGSFTTTGSLPAEYGPHQLIAHPSVEPTLSEDGNTAYWECVLCGKYFDNADGAAEHEIEENSWILEKTAVASYATMFTSSFRLAVIDTNRQYQAYNIEQLKDTYFFWDTDLIDAGITQFKVAKNGHTLNVYFPDNYILTESDPDADGVTTYTIVSDGKEDASYIDENGEEQTVRAIPITSAKASLTEGWYVAKGNVTINANVTINGDVRIILANGSDLTVTGNINKSDDNSLTFYRQSGTSLGKLTVNRITSEELTVIGGRIDATEVCITNDILIAGGEFNVDSRSNGVFSDTTNNAVTSINGDVTISGGEVLIYGNSAIIATHGTATISSGDVYLVGYGAGVLARYVVISGGKFYAVATKTDNTSVGIKAYEDITLGWTNAEDYIFSDGYEGDITLAKPFTDVNDRFYPAGTIAQNEIAGKRIMAFTGFFCGHSLSLNGDIAVNFYINLYDYSAADAVVKFSWGNGKTATVALADLEPVSGSTYRVPCNVAAKEMSDIITAELVIDGETVETNTYSVRRYAELIIANENGEFNDETKYPNLDKLQDLCRAMIRYGEYAENFFGNGSLDADDVISSVTEINAPDSVLDNLPDGVTFEGATLSLKSETTLSFYFKSSDTLTFSCGDMTVETVSNGDYQVARIRGIPAKELKDSFTLNVSGGSITYSPMNYCYNTLHGDTDDENLINVIKALYLYAQAADAYFP